MTVILDRFDFKYLATNNATMTVTLETTVLMDLSNFYGRLTDDIHQPIVCFRVFNCTCTGNGQT